ncbi:MAG: aminopeptidase P family protein [Candidatus Levybacteria bacterium]|nr:aminopeptidase P family protein [Candidatus Levybacteria bacterium]
MNLILKNLLKKSDALLISSRPNIIYLTTYPNFSETERECFLLLTRSLPAGKAGKQYLITDKRYSLALEEIAKDFEIIDTGALNFITKDAKNFFKKEKIKTIGFEDYDLTVSEYSKLEKIVKTNPIDLRNFRAIKQKKEIENIRKACKIGDDAFDYIIQQLKLGITEREVVDKLETFINSKGADVSFKPIIAFGKNSSIPHHMTERDRLRTNQIVLLDFGVKINNYCSDMSRTVFFGSASAEFKRIYKTVLEAQTKAIEYINGQLSMVNGQLFAKDIDKIARQYIIKQGYPNIIHSVGHGVGIEVHEPPHLSPTSKDIIKPGMVFSVEPGIYIPGFGGVRIEDLVFISNNKVELISHSNREIIEL